MSNINNLKTSKFLTRHDCGNGILVTIRGWEQTNVAKEGAGEELKYALSFNEVEKPLILNSTNGQIIASITKSGEFEDWVGKQIVLYDDPNISFAGKLTGGIRVRAPRIPAAKPAATQPAPSVAPKPPTVAALQDPDSEMPF